MTIISLDLGDTFRRTKACSWMSLSPPGILAWMQTLSLALDHTPVFQFTAYIFIHILHVINLSIFCILQFHVVWVCPSHLLSCSALHQFCILLLRSVTLSAQVWYLHDARKLFGQEAATQIRLDHCWGRRNGTVDGMAWSGEYNEWFQRPV